MTSLRIWIAQSKREKQKYQIVLKYSIRFIDEGTISDSDLRMLIDRIIISEKDGKLDINIILNVKFKEHTLNFDEVQILNLVFLILKNIIKSKRERYFCYICLAFLFINLFFKMFSKTCNPKYRIKIKIITMHEKIKRLTI